MKKLNIVAGIALAMLAACGGQDAAEPGANQAAETAEEFVARAHAEYADFWVERAAAGWVRATYITPDTGVLEARAEERYAEWHSAIVKQAVQYDDQELAPKTRRAINLLKLGTTMPAPDDDAKRKEIAGLATELPGMYGAGEYCTGGECRSGNELELLMNVSRDWDELLDTWVGWRTVSPPMRDKYTRFVELANEGAGELGYADLGEMWRSGYDMSPAEFTAETERLWQQVKPLYDELHCHVRAKLGEHYGEDKVPQDQPIPAHILGNMWAQSWGFLYDELMVPYPDAAPLDVDGVLETKNYSPEEMVRSAETFYTSLGMKRLPETFWERSMFVEPDDRKVVCHASAWTLDGADDLRIKMCIKQTYDELRVIYHELGHNYYQWAYKDQEPLFWGGAHSGFHEAIGDTVTLSMTPEYLAEVGLLTSAEQSREAVINRQMQQALDKIAFLPFGKLVDEWRWRVFSGEITPANYNQSWWDLRTEYQGIVPPVERSEDNFDPGAKYHVPANVSYTRYFLAHVLQFQFQQALCDAAGHEGELQACSVYESAEAGKRFWAMLEKGASQPWQDTLQELTGTREMDASAIIDYFEPLMGYLQEQNEGRSCGW